MRVTCLIDSLGSGGAQRQLCTLAVLLKQRGVDVSMLTYHPCDFFLPMLQVAGIPHQCVKSRSTLGRILTLRRALRRGSPDVVLAFLDGPCLYAELAALPWRRWGLVVSERLADPCIQSGRARWIRQFHRIADCVTANSHTNRLMIEQMIPALQGRVITVYNAVDFDAFAPKPKPAESENGSFRFVVASSFHHRKNVTGFIEAFAAATVLRPALDLRLEWYGGMSSDKYGRTDTSAYDSGWNLVHKHGLQGRVRLCPPSTSIADIYRDADAVVLPSFSEGLPNVICEAMACGRPILLSDVCDAANLVQPGYNGLLFDPASRDAMTNAVLAFCDKPRAEREAMGRRSHEMAVRIFAPDRIAEHYHTILTMAARRERPPLDHWVPEVPASARRYLPDTTGSCSRAGGDC
jgi:glycosyltransferase involved in cell wall biosynthesis